MRSILIVVITVGVMAVSLARPLPVQGPKKDSTATQTMTPKAHVCTAACKNGKHMYAHGEKGHLCTKNCSSQMAQPAKH